MHIYIYNIYIYIYIYNLKRTYTQQKLVSYLNLNYLETD